MILKSSTTGSAHLLWVQPRGQRDDPDIAWTIARIGNPHLNPPCPSSSSGSFSESSGSEPSTSEPSSSESSDGSGGTSGSGGGSGGGSGSGGGGGGGGGNCFLYGTLVRLADGRLVPIERLQTGDEVASLDIPGLARDAEWRAQYRWRAVGGDGNLSLCAARAARVRRGTHDGFYLINGRVKATFEHPFLIRRGDETGFCSAELLRVGDRLVRHDLADEPVVSIERIDRAVRTVALHVPGTNVYLADGVWVHNDALSSGSGSSESSSGGVGSSSKSSGSSFGGPGSSSSGSSGSGITVPF